MLKVPSFLLRDKQAYTPGMRLIGKPIEVAKHMKEDGAKLIHIVDLDALKGSTTNLDVYDKLTYLVNVEVECAPDEPMVRKLLSLKCRVVLEPQKAVASGLNPANLAETRLIVAKIGKGFSGSLDAYHDVLLTDADEAGLSRLEALGKRVLIYDKDIGAIGKRKPWAVISASS